MGKTPETDIKDLEKNWMRNAGLDLWQRFGPVHTFASNAYIQDRWFTGSTGPVLFERLNTSPPPGGKNYTRISYSASGTDNTNDFYYFEDIDLVKLKGKIVTFSLLVRRGGVLNDGFALRVFKSPVANDIAGPWTQIASTTFTDAQIPEWTNSPDDWVVMPVTFEIPDDGTANGLRVNYVNTVNPAASTFVEIAQPMLNIGGVRGRWSYFNGSYDADALACFRYYEKSSAIDVPPTTTSDLGAFQERTGPSVTRHTINYIEKRVQPIFTPYNPFNNGAANEWRDASASSNRPATLVQRGTKSTVVALTGPSNDAVVIGHWGAEADF